MVRYRVLACAPSGVSEKSQFLRLCSIEHKRKNWLFADTPKGASASAAVYSLIETAKANGLNVYEYLHHLLLYVQDTDWQNHPEYLDDLMPWSPTVQEECK